MPRANTICSRCRPSYQAIDHTTEVEVKAESLAAFLSSLLEKTLRHHDDILGLNRSIECDLDCLLSPVDSAENLRRCLGRLVGKPAGHRDGFMHRQSFLIRKGTR